MEHHSKKKTPNMYIKKYFKHQDTNMPVQKQRHEHKAL